jgi:hypothetical protein
VYIFPQYWRKWTTLLCWKQLPLLQEEERENLCRRLLFGHPTVLSLERLPCKSYHIVIRAIVLFPVCAFICEKRNRLLPFNRKRTSFKYDDMHNKYVTIKQIPQTESSPTCSNTSNLCTKMQSPMTTCAARSNFGIIYKKRKHCQNFNICIHGEGPTVAFLDCSC